MFRKLIKNSLFIFFLGPIIGLFVVRFTGYQIFYHGEKNDKERKRIVFLLSAGSFFYLLLILYFEWKYQLSIK